MPTSKSKVLSGVVWSALEKYSVQGVQFIVSIILARLLEPEDFGLIAIVMVFTTIFQTINEAGFNTALIHKQDRDELDYSTALFTNVAIGLLSYIVIFSCAPIIARFYGLSSLTSVMRVLSLTLIINSFGIVQNAKFTIKVDFKSQAKASLTASIISGAIGIYLAYRFRNVYGIVFQSLFYSIINVSLMWLIAKWKPHTLFSFKRFKKLFDYAYKLILSRLISVVFDDIYALAIGKLYLSAQLGYYNRANSFRQVLSREIINTIQRVSVPLLCEAQESNEKMTNILLRFIQNTAVIVYPLLAGLMVLRKPFIIVLIGEKWLPTADVILLICPISFFYLISTFNRNVFNATGRTDWALKAEIVKKILFVAVFLFTFRYSMTVLLIGLNVIAVFEMLYDIYFSHKQIQVTLLQQFKALSGIIAATFFMAIAILSVSPFISFNPNIHLLVGFIIGLIVYGAIVLLFNIAGLRIEIIKIFHNYLKK